MPKISGIKLNLVVSQLKTKLWFFLLLGLIIVHVYVQLPYISQTFTFDEIDYAFKAQLLLQGQGFHSINFHNRLPGIYLIYTASGLIFGDVTPIAVRSLTLATTSIAVVLFFLIISKTFNMIIASISALFFAIFFVDPAVEGHVANTETFAISFLLLAIWLFVQNSSLLRNLAPYVVGITLLFRPSMLFSAILFVFLIYKNFYKGSIWSLFVLIAKIALPILLTVFFMLIAAEIIPFLDWTLFRNSVHQRTPYLEGHFIVNAGLTFRTIFADSWIFWLTGIFGLALYSFSKDYRITYARLFLVTAAASILFSGWFFPHYFIELVPIIAFFAGLAISKIVFLKTRYGAVIVFSMLILIFVGFVDYFIDQKAFVEERSIKKRVVPLEDQKIIKAGYPQVLKEIQKNSKARIFVWDESSLIYILSKRVPFSYFSYKYPLLPDNLLYPTFRGFFPKYRIYQKQLMDEIYENQPDIIVVRKTDQLEEEIKIFPEFFQYLADYYFKSEVEQFFFYRKLSFRI